jgi:putative transposase
MDDVIERAYMSMPRKCKKLSYRIYVSACDTHSVIPLSSTTFCKRIRKNYTDREEYALRYGARAAYLKFGVFDQTKLPERPLQEVEVDHCLIDLIVVHPDSRKPIGRPWLTALLDRATRVVLGMHLSFEAPSYACLQRALAHAIWPKNLHGVEGLKDDWPCHGVPEFLICDNGKEFRSRSLRASEGLLRFKVVNLPFKSPWLKGSLERLFGTIGVQVFSWQQGATLSRTPEFYDPVRRAERTLAEVRELLLRWVVNDYHRERHPRLRCSPIERWRQLTELFPVRPVPDFDHIVRLTGAIVDRQISNVGVPHEGLLYSDKAVLERLLARRGGIQKNWLIRVDPYDLGEAWILDDEQGDWHCLPCTNQAISRGVSRFQHKLHQVTARRNLPRGQPVREQDLARAREACEAAVASLHSAGAKTGAMARAARYATGGDYFTGMPGALATRTATVDPRPLMVASDEVAAGTEIAPPDLTAEVSLLAATWVEAAR